MAASYTPALFFAGVNSASVPTTLSSSSVQFTKLYPAAAVAVEPSAVPVAGATSSLAKLTLPPVAAS